MDGWMNPLVLSEGLDHFPCIWTGLKIRLSFPADPAIQQTGSESNYPKKNIFNL